MKERFTENGIEYVRNGDYYIPNPKAERQLLITTQQKRKGVL